MVCGHAFTETAVEAFQQPFLFERIAFPNSFPGSEAKSLGVKWGLAAARRVLKMCVGDGSAPSEANYYLGRYLWPNDIRRMTSWPSNQRCL